jgi:hypothetical protein
MHRQTAIYSACRRLPPTSWAGSLQPASAFVWQLAKHNPYAARLICGASLHWCEQLTERTFLQVLALAGTQPDVLVARAASDKELWCKLLNCGISRENEIRHAAHISALQCVLTSAAVPTRTRWANAACAVRTPALQVADDTDD